LLLSGYQETFVPRTVPTLSPAAQPGTDSRGTREKILDGAARLFSQYGYNEGSIRNIAAAIGIRGPSLYHHFSSKEEITAALLRIAAETLLAELDPVLAAKPALEPEALLDAAIAAHLRVLFHPKRYFAALLNIYGNLPPDLSETATRELAPYLQAWIEILGRVSGGKTDLDVTEAQVFFVFGAINSVLEWHHGHRAKRFSYDDLRAILKRMLLDGLGAR
jgi:AcrR family transcriptional regulator